MASSTSLLPTGKDDMRAAENAAIASVEDLRPLLPELLKWLQDGNWPVFPLVVKAVSRTGELAVPYMRDVLRSEGDLWKYWIISELLPSSPDTVSRALLPELDRIAHSPTAGEMDAEVDEVARELLRKLYGRQDPDSF